MRFTFSKFKEIGSMGKERTYITDTAAENLSGKVLGSVSLSLYIFDNGKARIGEGYVNLSNVGAGQAVKCMRDDFSAGSKPFQSLFATSEPNVRT